MKIVRIRVLYLIIIIKSEVWPICHCLGLGHETMVCAVCLPVFLSAEYQSTLQGRKSDHKLCDVKVRMVSLPEPSIFNHYSDVIMGAMASQITSLKIVCSTIYLGADKSKHQSSTSLAFVRGIYRWPMNSPQKWPVTRKMFPFDDVIMAIALRCKCKAQLNVFQALDVLINLFDQWCWNIQKVFLKICLKNVLVQHYFETCGWLGGGKGWFCWTRRENNLGPLFI